MDTRYEFDGQDERPIVYVREVSVDELPKDVRMHAEGLKTLYAVHAVTGERLALVRDRNLAFVLARQNNMEPVTAH